MLRYVDIKYVINILENEYKTRNLGDSKHI